MAPESAYEAQARTIQVLVSLINTHRSLQQAREFSCLRTLKVCDRSFFAPLRLNGPGHDVAGCNHSTLGRVQTSLGEQCDSRWGQVLEMTPGRAKMDFELIVQILRLLHMGQQPPETIAIF